MSNSEDEGWNHIEMDDAKASAPKEVLEVTQVQKIAYEMETRQKILNKEFPQSVLATEEGDDDIEPVETDSKLPAATLEPVDTPAKKAEFDDSQVATPLAASAPSFSFLTAATKEPSPVKSPPRNIGRPTPMQLALPPTDDTTEFADILKERTKQRRLREDQALSNLRVQVSRLEAALNAESKRRITNVKQIHETAAETIQTMEEKLKDQVRAEMKRLDDRLSKLEDRMTQLETNFETTSGTIHNNLQSTSHTLSRELKSLQSNLQYEVQNRKGREAQLLDTIQQVSHTYEERWNTERQDRLNDIQTVQDAFEVSLQQKDVLDVEGKIKRELDRLRDELIQETQTRRHSDEEIVDALNRYTKQIQESLAAIVSHN